MSDSYSPKPILIEKRLFLFITLLLTSLRFFHFGTGIDLPHDWRQCDTAYYIQDFYENGIELLSPAVCWMGNYENLALEFPLPEAIVALGQHLLGDSMLVSRSIFLFFFLLAVYYFYRSARLLFGKELAQLSTIIYLLLPLSLFYSRAIHIDFFALAAAHAMLYYCLLAMQRKSLLLLIIASACTVIVFLVKPPYAFYFALPLIIYAWREERFKWLISRSWVFLFPLIAFLWWQQHAYAINHAAPDWEYILNYRKFDHNSHWYYGSLQQRLSLYNWKVISLRLFFEVGGGLGFILATWGIFRKNVHSNIYFLWCWLIGLIVYLLVFFNLNLFHNYYQLPFLGPLAIGASFGLFRLVSYGKQWMYIMLGLLGISSFVFAEYSYYELPEDLEIIGKTIQQHTPDDALLIVTYENFDCRNPRILYRANRLGWSLQKAAATSSVLNKLHKEQGVNYWAYIDSLPPMNLPSITIVDHKSSPLFLSESGSRINLYLYQWSGQ